MSDIELKNTPLLECHQRAGAKMVPFAGWNMPVQYRDGILAEHRQTREQAGLFDICHMGEFRITGPEAATALDAIFARPVFDQRVGVCRYNFLLNEAGKVLDDLIVYRLAEDDFYIVVNAGTRTTDAEMIQSQLSADLVFEDVSDLTAKLDLQGPLAAEVLKKTGLKIATLPAYFTWTEAVINDIPVLLSRTGYTGELGFELYFDLDRAAEMWNYLLTFDEVRPAGLGARDTLRLEMGYALYGHELTTDYTPLDAGYGAMLKLKELPERRFTGRAALEAVPPAYRLVAITLTGRRAARAGAKIMDSAGKKIGVVTSGVFAPSLGTAVAMGYVAAGEALEVGAKVQLSAGNVVLEGRISELPFYRTGTVRKKL
ncbi:MAG: glycine cleavage system aminomethyltransferase GcvT [Victivallaceae bacterium]|nr:glycine cleavage system aminomethyltransferase GcvT [Victivallaceae bacterium]